MGLFSSLKKKIKGTIGGKILSKTPGGKRLLGSRGGKGAGQHTRVGIKDSRDAEAPGMRDSGLTAGSRSGVGRLQNARLNGSDSRTPSVKPGVLTPGKPGGPPMKPTVHVQPPRPAGQVTGGAAPVSSRPRIPTKPLQVMSNLGGATPPRRRRPTGG